MAIIIVEGSDCVGKTTFAEMLSKKTGYEIVKGSSFEISELGAMGMYTYMMELLHKDDIIIDRFFYSNLVYGELFNYPMMLGNQYDKLVEEMDKKVLLVYLHAPSGTIKHRMSKRGDDMINHEDIDNILEGYKDVMYGDFRPKMMVSLDTTTSDFDIATSMIKQMCLLNETKAYIDS